MDITKITDKRELAYMLVKEQRSLAAKNQEAEQIQSNCRMLLERIIEVERSEVLPIMEKAKKALAPASQHRTNLTGIIPSGQPSLEGFFILNQENTLKYITASGSQPLVNTASGIVVQANTALATGTVTLAAGGVTFAIITAPYTSASRWEYGGLRGQGAITINPSAAVDLTVSFVNRQF